MKVATLVVVAGSSLNKTTKLRPWSQLLAAVLINNNTATLVTMRVNIKEIPT